MSDVCQMKLISVTRTPNAPKAFKAVFEDPKRTIRFGTNSNWVLNRSKTEADRQAYIARHSVNENHNAVNAGSLSRYILWGESRSWQKNVKAFKRRFNV
jgi:hypothetical protein